MSLWFKLRAFFRKDKLDAEMAEEMRAHLELQAAENEKRGMSPADARHAAQREFGGVEQIKERARDQRGWRWLEELLADLRFALRMLRKHPGFSAVAVLSLAFGIGANTAIFSLVNAMLLRSLPVKNPGELVAFRWSGHPSPDPNRFLIDGDSSFSPAIFERFRSQSTAPAEVFAFAPLWRLTALVDGQSEVVPVGQIVSGNYFAVLGVPAFAGRTLVPSDDAPTAPPVTMISYRYWQTRFAGDPAAIGKTVWLNNLPLTIVGIAPSDFAGTLSIGNPADFFVPLELAPRLNRVADDRFARNEKWYWWLRIMGRLRPGATAEQARAHLEAVFQLSALEGATKQPMPAVREAPRLLVGSGSQGMIDPSRIFYRTVLTMLAGIVGIVLLIACVNVANLLLARAVARRKEIGVRLALGAGRGRVVRQLLTESLLLSGLGGAVGTLFAFWSKDFLVTLLPSDASRLEIAVTIDWRVLGFTALVATLTGLFFGIVPALQTTRVDINAGFAGGTRNLADRGRSTLAKSLMVAQVALSLMLLVGAGVFIRTFGNLKGVDPGFNRTNLLLFAADATAVGYSRNGGAEFYRRMAESLAALPGVRGATYSAYPVLSGETTGSGIHVPGFKPASGGEYEMVRTNGVGPDFFHTLQIPLLFGRVFDERDRASSQRVVIFNQAMARKFFGEENVIGRQTSFGEIVGVVRDSRDSDLKRTEPLAYVPFLHYPLNDSFATGRVNFAVRAEGSATAIVASIRQVVHDLDPKLPLFNVRTQEEQIERLTGEPRLFAQLSGFFGLLAGGLACVGLYGLMSYSVQQRTNEIGVRMALGAQPARMLWMVLRESLSLVGVGVAAGFVGAVMAVRLVSGFLFAVSPFDPLAYGGAALLLGVMATFACWLPARRAAKVDPMVALRAE